MLIDKIKKFLHDDNQFEITESNNICFNKCITKNTGTFVINGQSFNQQVQSTITIEYTGEAEIDDCVRLVFDFKINNELIYTTIVDTLKDFEDYYNEFINSI